MHGAKILIAAQSESLRADLKQAFFKHSIAIHAAITGQDTLQLAEQYQPDIVILGGDFPDLNGLETCQRLKASPAPGGPLILFLSDSNPADKIRYFEAGADACLAWPISEHELQAQVQALLRLKSRLSGEWQTTQPMRDLVNSNIDGMLVIDLDGFILFANPAACELLNQPAEQILGLPVGLPLVGEDFTELEIIRPGEALRTVEMRVREINWQGQPARLAALRDITWRKQAQTALDEACRFNQATIDGLSAHLCVLDEQGVIVNVNRAWRAFAEANPPIPPNYGLGQNYLELCDRAQGEHAEEAQPFAAGLRAVMLGQAEQFSLEYPCHSPDGGKHWFIARVNRFPIGQGAHIVITHEDITTRILMEAALRQSEEQNRLLFEEAPDAVALLSLDGRFLRANRACEELTGFHRRELIGENISVLNIISAQKLDCLQIQIGHALQEEPGFLIAEFEIQRRGGEIRQVESHLYLLQMDGSRHILATIHDISTRKRVESALRLANEELEKAMRVKDQFLASVTHELRTPLTGILGLSQALQTKVYGSLTEKQSLTLHHIEKSAGQLQELINDLLDLSKLEAGRFDLSLQPCPVAEVCQESLKAVQSLAEGKRQSLELSLPSQALFLSADRRRLKQMLLQLLGNAIKFTPSGGRVGIAVEQREANQIALTVWDTGKGIAPENLPRLFQRFVQLDSSLTRQQGGTGLGLILVKKMAELHGGSVQVESTLGVGSRFSILLPSPKNG